MTIDAKVRALLVKTVKNGCTPAEQETATAKAHVLVKQYGLKESDFTWPARPKAEPKKTAKAAQRSRPASKAGKGATRVGRAPAKPTARPTRGDEVVELLRRKDGATIEEMVKRFGLLPHSIRAIISVESRKRGLKVELVGKAHYRLAD